VTNPIFLPFIKSWIQIMNADPVQEKPMMKDKLRTMLSGYDAVIDAPAILFSGELAEIILYDKR